MIWNYLVLYMNSLLIAVAMKRSKKAITGGLSYYITLEECQVQNSVSWGGGANFAPQGTFG